MAIKESSQEMRGMVHRELEAYFLAIGKRGVGKGLYVGPNWEVNLSDPWICTLGSLQVMATQVTFKAEEEAWPELLKAFRLRFLTAGG